jgi:hypothetical protein
MVTLRRPASATILSLEGAFLESSKLVWKKSSTRRVVGASYVFQARGGKDFMWDKGAASLARVETGARK